MYQRFYGLTKKPFHTTPDPDFLYLSPSHKQALGTIMYGIEQRKGFIAVLGEVGLGKTTILRSVLAQIDTHHNRIIYLLNPNLSFRSFLQTLLRELGQPQESQDEAELVSHIHDVLIDEYEKGKTVVLFIDEAQNMPVPTLEGLRLLSNLETEKDKLIQIVLVGQPELRHILEQHELRQLDQRIAIRATIFPLTTGESHAYIQHRLDLAGGKIHTIFSKAALSTIIRYAKGNPRQINRLCDNALVTGVGYNKSKVTAKIVKEVIADMQGTRPHASWKWIPMAASLVCILLASGWVMIGKPIGSLDFLSLRKASDFITYEVNKANLLPITQETNGSLDYRKALVMKSELVPSEQKRSHTKNNMEEFLPRNGPKNNDIQNQKGEGKIDMSQKDTLLTEEHKKLPSRESLPDKMVSVEPVFSQSNEGESSLPNNRVIATKVVREGDTLEKLLREVYGVAGTKNVQLVLSHNPHLESAKKIFPDQVVTFPALGTGIRDGERRNVVLGKSKSLVEKQNELVARSKDISTQSSSQSEGNPQASHPFPSKILAVATVQDGDTLERLARVVYGTSKPLYIKEILRANPHIQGSSHLSTGQTVRFPNISEHENEKATIH